MDLSALLAGLGPWGPLAGIGIGVLGMWLKNRKPNTQRPVLNGLLDTLSKLLAPHPAAADIDHATAAKVIDAATAAAPPAGK